jgi:hypothetical protein
MTREEALLVQQLIQWIYRSRDLGITDLSQDNILEVISEVQYPMLEAINEGE